MAVVGGGVTALAAARRLALAGATVTVFEATDRWGGQLRTVDVGGVPVDVGAEALHLGAPTISATLDELGLADQVVEAASGRTWVVADGRLRPLPAGVGPAGPTRVWPLVSSRTLSPSGLVRAALEPLVPRGPGHDDVAVGSYLAHRFGHQVVDRLVDPLLGGLHAGDVRRLSLRSATPQLAAVASRSRSLLLRARPAAAGAATAFVTPRGGLRTLVDRLVADLRDLDAAMRADTPVLGIDPHGVRYRLVTSAGTYLADAVVLAVPTRRAARLLTALAPRAAAGVARQRAATVAVAVHAYPRRVLDEAPALAGTGLLVGSREGRLLKAATFLTSKWPHLADHEYVLVRLSAGRAGDDTLDAHADDGLAARLHEELADILGLRSAPVTTAVFRWPHGLPQLEVGHPAMLAAVRDELALHHPRVTLAGAAYDGLGVAACLASAERAAVQTLACPLDPAVPV